ncbi:SLAM family member 5-like [Xyrauchen texanus]|uniref:SLAM family member 5-like n=1 Tax=Xyrauchen texanus TaxID=154827 RepID=UPI002241DFFD|nr:SLAM family member 5-like [Xyrauchen texanus]
MSCLSETVKKMLAVTFCLCFWSLFGVFGVETDVSVSVMEGDSVTLKNDDTQILRDDLIMWKFGQILIAEINRNNKIKLFEKAADGRYRGRIQLDNQTGSLIITNIRTTDSGQYKLTTTSKETRLKIFTLTVYALLPVPVITSDFSLNSSSSESSSKCVLVCSVVNVTQATLSWYKGNSLLSSISVSDLNRSLSLHLECVDDSYSCVINNPIRNQTKHLNINEVCQPCSGTSALILMFIY